MRTQSMTRRLHEEGNSEATDISGVFWRGVGREERDLIAAHNDRIGAGIQPLVSRFVTVYLLGLPLFFLLHLFLRVRVEGREHLENAGDRAILACRHFFEWDPLVSFPLLFIRYAWSDPRRVPSFLAGQFWTRTPARRAVSWVASNFAVIRGDGADQVAFDRVRELMHKPGPRYVAIFPTGPVGHKRNRKVRLGVAHLAMRTPEVPVVPLTMTGIRGLRWRDVLLLRRPEVQFAFGRPFVPAEISEESASLRLRRITERIEIAWMTCERSLAANEARYAAAKTAPAPTSV